MATRAVSLGSQMFLIALDERRIFLVYDYEHYRRGDLIPQSLVRDRLLCDETYTASQFVRAFVSLRYDNDPETWDPLIRRFLSSEPIST